MPAGWHLGLARRYAIGADGQDAVARVRRRDALDFFILGTGNAPWLMPEPLRLRFRDAHISVDTMTTGPAVRTYNVMLIEGRRVGAGLIAIE